MKKSAVVFCVLLLAITVSLPLTGEEKSEKKMMIGPEPEAEAFAHHIMKVSPYKGWGHWPGHDKIAKGKSPHGDYIMLYANPIALKAAREGAEKMPHGAIIMKENYDKDKNLVALTPMYRYEGYNPEGGDWYWAKMGPDGKTMADGKLKGCIDCHAKVKNKDWIFHPPKAK